MAPSKRRWKNKVGDIEETVLKSVAKSINGSAKLAGSGVSGTRTELLERSNRGGLATLVSLIRHTAQKRPAALVLDNFESIILEESALKQLASIIISADDDSIAKYDVQIIIVGVPGNLKEAIARLPNAAPVANRLVEIPEVERMSREEAHTLIHKGFVEELGLIVDEQESSDIYGEICWVTDRIAQHIHELCLAISQRALFSDRKVTPELVEDAIGEWTNDTLSTDMGVIEIAMNARETKAGRKNQVLYSMALCETEDFKYSDIENILKSNFDVGGATLNVSQILSGFANMSTPLIRRTPKQDAWRFASPKYKMAIRIRLQKGDNGKVFIRQT
jgi:hypothetical protein